MPLVPGSPPSLPLPPTAKMLSSFVALSLAVALLPSARSQTTNATCVNPASSWTSNSRGQSPCLMTAYLENACEPDAGWEVIALPTPGNNQTYGGPSASQATPCTCSSAVYSLISACAYCQGNPAPFWSDWTEDCSTSYNGVYPHTIPEGTTIPAWAFGSISGDQWDPTIARAAQQANPQESLAPGATPISTGSSSTSSSPTSSSTAPPSPSNTTFPSTKKKSNVGAIVGGTVGGILGAIALAIVGFFVRRGHQKSISTSTAELPFSNVNNDEKSVSTGVPTVPSSPDHLMATNQQPPMKLYDPNDPSTFPTATLNYMPSSPTSMSQEPQLTPPPGVQASWQTVNGSSSQVNSQWQHQPLTYTQEPVPGPSPPGSPSWQQTQYTPGSPTTPPPGQTGMAPNSQWPHGTGQM